jgi:hypothetical protein
MKITTEAYYQIGTPIKPIYKRITIAANAPNPAIIAPPLLTFTCSAAFVDVVTAPELVAVPLPAPFVADAPTRLVLVTVLCAPPPTIVVVDFVPAAEVVLFPLEVVVFVAAVTLNELPINTVKPALFTTLTAEKFVLVIPNLANVLSALELPVVLSNN